MAVHVNLCRPDDDFGAVSMKTVKLPLIKQCTVSGPPFGRSTQGLLRESVYYSTSRHLASST